MSFSFSGRVKLSGLKKGRYSASVNNLSNAIQRALILFLTHSGKSETEGNKNRERSTEGVGVVFGILKFMIALFFIVSNSSSYILI